MNGIECLRDEFFDVVARIKVPKSKVFHDVRAPCPESHLASRNAKVLCPKGEIDRDTKFYKRVLTFRNERATKNQSGEGSTKLYIPGRIIYLVDTMGDGKKYVPYWASRYEFNQVILSGRMLADHAIPPLVDILRNLNLDDVHEVKTWHVDDIDAEDEVVEVRLVIPFSNPQGKIPLILMVFVIIACTFAAFSNQGCRYVERSTMIVPPDGGSPYPGMGVTAGLWSYNLKICLGGESCNGDDLHAAGNYEDSGYCQPYSRIFTPDTHWSTARAFGSTSVLLGFLSLCLISTATCTKLKRRTWIVLCALYLFITLCQGLQFLLFKSDLCTELTLPNTNHMSSSECTLSTDGMFGITAAVFWFVTAIGCSHMARMAK